MAGPLRWNKKCGGRRGGPLYPRLCSRNSKVAGSILAKTLSGEQSLIRMTSIALPKSPVNFA